VTGTLALLLQEGLRIGFVPVRWLDLLDIAITAVLVYQVYRLIRGTIAVQVAVALLGLYAVNEVVRAVGLTTLTTLFGAVGDVFRKSGRPVLRPGFPTPPHSGSRRRFSRSSLWCESSHPLDFPRKRAAIRPPSWSWFTKSVRSASLSYWA